MPTEQQRLEVRDRPHQRAIMYQSWKDLLFLHWEVESDLIQSKLPEGLFVDTFDRKAYVGVVPFFMRNIRFRGTPAMPWVSNFLELNLRTYVFDEAGNPGVWFFSLDCNQPLAVWTARTLFHLPYQHAAMSAEIETSEESGGLAIDYRSKRNASRDEPPTSHFNYLLEEECFFATPGSLEFFLAERYLLFAVTSGGKIRTGQVHHTPYPLCKVQIEQSSTDLFELNGISTNSIPHVHAIGSRGVDVEIFPLQ